jgi:hypothetical protein
MGWTEGKQTGSVFWDISDRRLEPIMRGSTRSSDWPNWGGFSHYCLHHTRFGTLEHLSSSRAIAVPYNLLMC